LALSQVAAAETFNRLAHHPLGRSIAIVSVRIFLARAILLKSLLPTRKRKSEQKPMNNTDKS
jgi:hypothetical protein